MCNLFLLNTASLEDKDILNILTLAGITQEMDFDSEIAKAPEGVKEFIELAKLYYQRNETSTSIAKFTVRLDLEKCVVADVPAKKNEIRLVCDESNGNTWYLVAEKTDGGRFEKEVSALTEEEAQESFLCGVNLHELKSHLEHQTVDTLNYQLWPKLKSDCFSHPNPLHEMGDWLRAHLDCAHSDLDARKIKNIREYMNNQAKEQNTSLIIYSNKSNEDSCGRKECHYLKEKVKAELSHNQQLHVLYIGGGHGWPKQKWNGMLSALKTQNVDELHDSFLQKKITINTIILGSCFSASYATNFSRLLHPECGVMLSSTVSQGGSNFFENAVSIVLQEQQSRQFFKTIQQDRPCQNPTGICISDREKHCGLELSEDETGLPGHAVEDEYELSLSIVLQLRKEKPKSTFGITLDECHEHQQKEKFNELLDRAVQASKNPSSLEGAGANEVSAPEQSKGWSPLAKFSLFAGGVILVGGACYLLSQNKSTPSIK